MIELEENTFPPQVKQILQENELNYRKNAQIAHYSNLDSVKNMEVFTKFIPKPNAQTIFCCHGDRYDAERSEKILYFIIRTLDEELPLLKGKYSFAYVCHSFSDFFYFKTLIQQLPEHHFLKLRHIYIADNGMLVKVMEKFAWGPLNEFLVSRLRYIQALTDIQEEIIMPPPSRIQKPIQTQVKVIKNKLYGKNISDYTLNSIGIPIIIENLIKKLYSNPKYLSAEGIMRKSCNIQLLEELQTALMEEQTSYQIIDSHDNPYTIAGCLKKIFNNLHTPLFSYKIYDDVIEHEHISQEMDLKYVKGCVERMQEVNAIVLAFLIGFLKKGIEAHKHKNLMNSHNLGVVFGPCLFRPREYRVEDLMYSGKLCKVIVILIDNFERIFLDKARQVEKLLEKGKK